MKETYGIEPRMDGTPEQKLAWRVLALREALRDVTTLAPTDAAAHKVAENAISVDDNNASTAR